MAPLRFVKNKLRDESPRLKDVPGSGTVRDPSEGRTADGRFKADNRLANGQAAKAVVRQSLGAVGEDAGTLRQAVVMYRAMLRELPSTGASVRQLVAARVRHSVMATRYAGEAAKVGLASPLGIKMAEQSRSHDLAAQRLAVTAYDLAIRGAKGEAPDLAAEVARAEREAAEMDRKREERRALPPKADAEEPTE